MQMSLYQMSSKNVSITSVKSPEMRKAHPLHILLAQLFRHCAQQYSLLYYTIDVISQRALIRDPG